MRLNERAAINTATHSVHTTLRRENEYHTESKYPTAHVTMSRATEDYAPMTRSTL